MMPFSFAEEIRASVRASSWSASIPAAPSPLEDPPTARIRVLQSSGRSAPVMFLFIVTSMPAFVQSVFAMSTSALCPILVRIAGVEHIPALISVSSVAAPAAAVVSAEAAAVVSAAAAVVVVLEAPEPQAAKDNVKALAAIKIPSFFIIVCLLFLFYSCPPRYRESGSTDSSCITGNEN